AGLAVERRLPELVLVHLAEALVALERHALAAGGVDRLEKLRGAGDNRRISATGECRGFGKGFAQRPSVLVETACVGRGKQARVEDRGLPDATDLARQHI